MVKSPETLKKTYEFRRVYEGGKNAACRYAAVYARPNGERFDRFGFSVSKKVGNAVVRNKVRRRLKQIVREITEKRNFGGLCLRGRDFVIVARAAAAQADYKEIRGGVVRVLNKLWDKTVNLPEIAYGGGLAAGEKETHGSLENTGTAKPESGLGVLSV